MVPEMDVQTLLAELASQGVELHSHDGALHYKAPHGVLDAQRLMILRSFKNEIIQYLDLQGAAAPAEPIAVSPRPTMAPLSVRQRDFWLHSSPNPEPWNTYSVGRFTGRFDIAALTQSVELLTQRHEALRTRIVERFGNPWQTIDRVHSPHIETHDLSDTATSEREMEVRDLVQSFMHRRIPRDTGPLFRVCLVRIDSEDQIVAMVLDHIISDARSITVLRAELWQAYFAFAQGASPELPPVPLQFADYTLWEERALETILRDHLPFWIDRLSNASVLMLPVDQPRSATRAPFASTGGELCDAATTTALRRLAMTLNSTMPMVVLSGCLAVLWRWTGQNDLVIRSTVSARVSPNLANTVGFLLNHVLLRVSLANDPTFAELVNRVRTFVLDSHEHTGVPLNSILPALDRRDAVALAEGFSFNYLPYDMVQSYRIAPTQESQVKALTQYHVNDESEQAFVEMMCAVIETSDRLMARLRYASDLFHPETSRRLMTNFAQVLRRVAIDPAVSLSHIELS